MRLVVDVPDEGLEELRKTWNNLFNDVSTSVPKYKSIHEKKFIDKVKEAMVEMICDW